MLDFEHGGAHESYYTGFLLKNSVDGSKMCFWKLKFQRVVVNQKSEFGWEKGEKFYKSIKLQCVWWFIAHHNRNPVE